MNTAQEITETPNTYSTKKEDPKYLKSLVNKYVKVQLIKNTSFTGFIHSIDPITQSMILSTPKDENFETTIIPGLAILNITELPMDGVQPSKKLVTEENNEELMKRKSKLIAWFKQNLLPVTECEDKIIVQTVSILRPFTSLDIYAENPVIALQIRKMMESLPDNFNE